MCACVCFYISLALIIGCHTLGGSVLFFFFFLFTASSARFGCGLAKNSVQQRRSVVLKILSCVEIVANAIQIAGVQGNQC